MAPRLVAGLLFAATLAGCLGPASPTPVNLPGTGSALSFAADCTIGRGAGGAAWPEPCVALASPNDSPSKAEVDLAVNPKDPLNIIVGSKDLDPKASDCVWSVLQVTKDGGKSWKTVYVGGDLATREPTLAQYKCVTDPIMTFDSKGVAYYALQAYEARPRDVRNADLPELPVQTPVDNVGSAFYLARSRDGGVTWEHYIPLALGDGSVAFHDYPRMLSNPKTGSVSTIWNAVKTAPYGPDFVTPMIVTSRDGGETADKPVTLMVQDAPNGTEFFSGFTAGADGTVYVTTVKSDPRRGNATDVWIWKSTDDARTFTELGKAFTVQPMPRSHGDHRFRTSPKGELAIDTTQGPHAGRLYMLWSGWDGSFGEILSAFSDDGGKTWSQPTNIARDPARGQFWPRIAVGSDGTVHAQFATQAFSGSEMLDHVHAWSTDGGFSWQNRRLTNVSYDGDKGLHQDGFPFMGDYNGLGTGPDGSVAIAWGDTATGRAEIAFARILPGNLASSATAA